MRKLLSALVSMFMAAGLLVGFGASVAQAAETVNNEFGQLKFNYVNHVNITPSPGVSCSDSSASCTGKNVGDQVLFKTVRTINGVTIDALVTTESLVNAKIDRYFVGANSGASGEDLRVNLTQVSSGGYTAVFKFKFFVGGTYGTAEQEEVVLQNMQQTAMDVDGAEYVDFGGIQSYTLMTTGSNLVPDPVITDPNNFPADVRFSSQGGAGVDRPEDQVTVSYGELSETSVQLGRSTGGVAYFSIKFRAVSFGANETSTVAKNYNLEYQANGGQGDVPATQIAPLGSKVVVSDGNALEPPDSDPEATFDGWNTKADGTGTKYQAGADFTIGYPASTLYAVWLPSPPHRPGKPTATVTGDGKVAVTVPPATTGRQPTEYTVVAFDKDGLPEGTCEISLPADPAECVVDELDGTKVYRFKAVAQITEGSKVLSSDPSEASDAVIPGPPAAPAAPEVAVLGSGTVGVTVVPASSGAPATSYVTTAWTNGAATEFTCPSIPSNLTCSIPDLDPATAYTFVTTATNDVGNADGPPSSSVIAAAPGMPRKPVSPADGYVVNAKGDVTFSFRAGDTGGTPATYSLVLLDSNYQPTGEECLNIPASGPLECTIGGLTAESVYVAMVTASNGAGTSSPLQIAAWPTFAPGKPPAPTGIQVVGTGKIEVQALAPVEDDDHGQAREFQVTARIAPGGAVVAQSCRTNASAAGPWSCVVEGLNPALTYEFSTLAHGNGGWGTAASDWSAASAVANIPPGAQQTPIATATGAGAVKVAWPLPAGGTPTSYVIKAFHNGTEVPALEKNFDPAVQTAPFEENFTGLNTSGTWTFTVQGSNVGAPGGGVGPVSDPSNGVIANVPADKPATPVMVLTGLGTVQATITPNASGAGVDEYTVYAFIEGSETSSGTCSAAITAAPWTCEIENLDPTRSYIFRSVATNSAGTSVASDPSSVLIPGKPGTPGKPTPVVMPDGAVNVMVVAPTEGGVPTSYTVTPNPATGVTPASCTITVPGDSLNKCEFIGLDDSVNYTFSVTATNAAGTSSAAVSDPINAAVPAQPQKPIATLTGAGKVKVKVVPAQNPGRVTDYWVLALDANGSPTAPPVMPCAVTPGAVPLECEFSGLVSASTYTFAVIASNDMRSSERSELSDPIVPNVPAKPGTPVAVLAGLSDVDVTFTAGASATHGAPASYEVTAVPGGQSCTVAPDGDGNWPSPLSCRVSGLNPSQENEFVVQAKNAAGDSDLSELSNKVTAEAPDAPLAPTVVVDAPEDVTVTVVPAPSGGTPSSYTIQAYIGDEPVEGKTCTVQATDSPLSCPITGLDKDTEYTFTATAFNVVEPGGVEGAHSSPAVFPNVKPAQPATPTAQVTGLGALSVEVAPNAGTGTDEYILSVFEDGNPIACPIDSCTIPATPTPLKWNLDDLGSTKSYTFVVEAKNSAGTSVPSDMSAAIVPAAPGAPPAPTAAVTGKGAVEVTVAPSTTGGPAASYEAFALDGDGERLSPTKSCTVQADADPLACEISGLDPVTPVTFEVVATNAAGSSVASGPSTAVTPNTPPNRPGKPTTKVTGDGEVTVTVPPTTGGGQPTKYIVIARDEDDPSLLAGTCTITLPASPVECKVDGLDNDKPYTFSAVAENIVNGVPSVSDVSEASDPVIPGPAGAPGKPAVKPAGPGEVEVTVSPSTTGGTPTSYTVTSQPGGKTCTVSATANPLRCTVKGLTPDAAYMFTAVATNGAGTSPASEVSGSVKAGAPAIVAPNKPAKEKVKGKPNAAKFVVTWTKPKGTDAKRPVTGYRLTVKLRGKKKTIILRNLSKSTTKYTLTRKQLLQAVKKSGLQVRGESGGRFYVFTVSIQAKNSAGFSKASSSRLVMKR